MMRHALVIFRKDVRRLGVPLAGFVALMAIFGWMEAVLPRRREFQSFPYTFEILLLIAGVYLAVMAMHQEALPGDRQYWITRPISRGNLFLSKAIFILVFFNLPVFGGNLAALIANGLSPVAFLVPLIAKQVFLTALLILPVMVLASLTRDLGQFVIALFVVFAVVLVTALEFSEFPASTNWGGFAWIRTSAIALIAIAASVAALALQYRQRRTVASAAIAIAGVMVCAAAPGINLWHTAFQLRSGTPPSALRLTLDATRDLTPGRGVFGIPRGTERYVRILLPVRLSGIPAGSQLLSERIAARIQNADGTVWSSGWNDAGGTYRLEGEKTLLPQDGAYWQYFYIDRPLYERVKDAPADLRTSAAFTLLSAAATTRLATPTRLSFVPAFGYCATSANGMGEGKTINSVLVAVCLAPFQLPEWSAMYIQSRRTGRIEEFGRPQGSIPSATDQPRAYGPYPVNLYASAWDLLGDVKPVYNGADFDVLLESRR
ncbi:MAG TPA: hypothetical protein VNV86_01095, partial [Candidatus Acidoferrum sp.]|nr:hypothetical protein [Candidatus Acidoferrum sp.]